MDLTEKPRADLALQILPPPLLRALEHVYAQGISEVMLIGGTALAGFYAGHRRSDDLDLFAKHPQAYRAAVLAAQSLAEIGTELSNEYKSAQFFHASCKLDNHNFTIDIALDSNLFRVGAAHSTRIAYVASLETLLRTKSATMVSRCGEKDLYDLLWILENIDVDVDVLLELGQSIDSGVNAESVLMSLCNTTPKLEACDFGLSGTSQRLTIYRSIAKFKAELERIISLKLHDQPIPPLGQAVRQIRRWQNKG